MFFFLPVCDHEDVHRIQNLIPNAILTSVVDEYHANLFHFQSILPKKF